MEDISRKVLRIKNVVTCFGLDRYASMVVFLTIIDFSD
jgi:hypothetical protein